MMSIVKNYMEILTAEYLEETLERSGGASAQVVRGSPDLKAAVMAEALNHIPPFYVTCKEGEVYGFSTGAIPQNKADIMVEIAKGIEVVAGREYTK